VLVPFTHTPAGEIPAALQEVLAEVFAGEGPDDVAPAELDGFYQVMMGQNVYYFSADGRYALRGDLYDIENGRNLSEERRGQARLDVLRELGEESMIVFRPSPAKHTVTVFTDVDCGFCAKLHRQMAHYNRLGIAIRYVAYPRAGIPSPSYDKTVSVWCSDDPHQAIGDAKFGRPLAERTCDNPVSAHYAAGQKVGVRGTPALLLESGDLLGGYLPPDELLTVLDEDTGEG
jgi:thiol:disulfide interchange protein DsbC